MLTSPAAGTTFAGTSQAFVWSTGTGATGYRLGVGSTQGATDLFNGAQTMNLNATVSSLPNDGRAVWARLSTLLGGVWQSSDYSFTAMTTPSLSINNVSVAEGNTGTSTATFTVTLAPSNLTQSVTVAYATANQTATTANSDYVAASGTLTFGAGVTTRYDQRHNQRRSGRRKQ